MGISYRQKGSKSSLKILPGKYTKKRSLSIPKRKWEDNIRTDVKEIGINTMNWFVSPHSRDYWRALMNAALKFWVT